MSIEIKERSKELIVYSNPKLNKKRDKILNRQSSAKNFKTYLEASIKLLREDKNFEDSIFLEELLKKYLSFETNEKVILKNWKGKSSFQVIKKPDSFEILTFQRSDQDSIPHEIKREISKNEINKVWLSIQKLNKGEKINTRDIGELTYNKNWDEIFSDRNLHINLNLILRLLDYFGITHYRGRYTKVLKRDIQAIL